MATKGKKLIKAFKDLGLNPKNDTPEELEKWLKEMPDRKTDTKSTTVHTNQPVQFSMDKMQQKVK